MRILTVIPDRLSSIGKCVISNDGRKSLTRQLFLLNFCINVVLVVHMLLLIILFDVTYLQKKPLYFVLSMVGLVAISSIALMCLLYSRYVISKKNNEVDFKVMSSGIKSLTSLPQKYKSFENLLNATDCLERKNRLESIEQDIEQGIERGNLFVNNSVDNVTNLGVKVEESLQDSIGHYRCEMLKIYEELGNIVNDISRVTKLSILNPSFFTKDEEILKALLETGKLISKQKDEINLLLKSCYEKILPIITSVIRMIKLHESYSQKNDEISLFDKDSSTLKELNAVLIKAESMFQKLDKQEIACPSFEELHSIVWFIKSFISSTLYVPKKDMGEEAKNVVKKKAKRVQKVVMNIFSTFNDCDVVNQEDDEALIKKNVSEKDALFVVQLLQLQDIMLGLCVIQLSRLESISTVSSIDCGIVDNIAASDVAVQVLQNASSCGTLNM